MEYEELLLKTKWNILKEVAKGDKSASEIAKKTGQSIANTAQQLKLLEAYNIIKKSKVEQKNKPGKPKTPYVLNQEMFITGFIKQGVAEKKIFKIKETDDFHNLVLNVFFTTPVESHYALYKYLCTSDMIKKADSIAITELNDKEIHLLIITNHVEDIRTNFSNMSVPGLDGKTKKIISWAHSIKEIEEGLDKKEDYFQNLVKKSIELMDSKNYLKKIKEKV